MLYSLSNSQSIYSTANGTTFRAVLNYVEDGTLNFQYAEEIAEALTFLQFEEKRTALRQRIEAEYKGQSPENQLHFTQALRTLGNDGVTLPLPINFREVTPEILALMIKVGYDRPINLSTLNGFKRSINSKPAVNAELTTLLSQFKTVVAGGMPVSEALQLPAIGVGDDDVWVYGENAEERLDTFNKVNDHFFKRGGVVAGTKGDSVLVFSLPGYPRNIQLILTSATSPEEVAESFDIDACKAYIVGHQGQNWLAWNQPETYVLPEALQAWESNKITQVSVIDPLRLEKMKRRGFEIGVPYEAPEEDKFQDYLHRSYIHNPLDSKEQITYLMKKLTGANNVCFSSDEVKACFTYREIYDLNIHYDHPGGKTIPDSRGFTFIAHVTEITCEKMKNRSRRLHLLPQDFPPELQALDNELQATYQRGVIGNDGLSIYVNPIDSIPPNVATGRYTVELRYAGVRAPEGRPVFYPIIRVSKLTLVA